MWDCPNVCLHQKCYWILPCLFFLCCYSHRTYSLRAAARRLRQWRHDLINDSTRHSSGHSSTQSTCRFEMDVQFIALGFRERCSSPGLRVKSTWGHEQLLTPSQPCILGLRWPGVGPRHQYFPSSLCGSSTG